MAIWSHTWMLANIVYSFEYGQLSTHNQNVGVQEMTSVAPRPTPSQSCVQRTATLYTAATSLNTPYPTQRNSFQDYIGRNVLSPLYKYYCISTMLS